ncbi:hypothetical protein PV327_001887 [Microctonus hyperodae]|uniref:phospholipase A1 n=1 Tax=Microctonus hyperodae TaxID=165561 RepID=A0AA39FEF0_MICHY|nr:hypothetical protein PV327_001887 [Microctonus hyperodae]
MLSLKVNLTPYFYAYSSNGSTSKYKDSNVTHADDLVSQMDKNKPTVFYIHGFTENVEKNSVLTIVDAYNFRNDHNIIAVDWSKLAALNYLEVATCVDQVGKQIAIAIQNMLDAGLQIEKIDIVAHSMGAHVAGEIGRCISNLPRIVGLDPAGPLASYIRVVNALRSTDAKNVVIIHTDAGVYGINYSIGTVDFWPNHGKRIQPGCPRISVPLSKEDFCSHHQSWVFYAESLRNETAFMGVKYSEMGQPCSEQIVMGYATPRTASGDYFLTTASKSPYGLGATNAKC